MSLTTRKRQTDAVPPAAVERARQAGRQLGPLAKSARDGAAHRIHDARVWAAPRIETAAQSVQENVAPKVSAALEATAHRLEPAPEKVKALSRRAQRKALATSQEVIAHRQKALAKTEKRSRGRRWPRVAGGVAFLAATIGAITAVAMRRNREKLEADLDEAARASADMSDEPRSARAESEAGFDGQVRTP